MANEQLVLARATPIEIINDLLELQMRREVERLAIKTCTVVYFAMGEYHIHDETGRIYKGDSLTLLHTKLKELTDET